MLKKIIIGVVIAMFIIPVGLHFVSTGGPASIGSVTGTEVGVGWSTKHDSGEAVREVISMALRGKKYKTPDFVIIFASAGSDIPAIFSKARKILGANTKIYGGASESEQRQGNNKGFLKSAKKPDIQKQPAKERGLLAVTFTSRQIHFGVGSVDYSSYSTVQAAVKTAALSAIKNAGKSKGKAPKLVLVTHTAGAEKELACAIKEVVGKSTIIICRATKMIKPGLFGERKVYAKGISLAFVYTNLPIGLNVLQRSYEKIKKPDAVKGLLVLSTL